MAPRTQPHKPWDIRMSPKRIYLLRTGISELFGCPVIPYQIRLAGSSDGPWKSAINISYPCLVSDEGFFEFWFPGTLPVLLPVNRCVKIILLRVVSCVLEQVSVEFLSSVSSVVCTTVENRWFDDGVQAVLAVRDSLDVVLHRWFIHELSWSFSLIIFPNEWLHEINFLAW